MKKPIVLLSLILSLSSCITIRQSKLKLPEPEPIHHKNCTISSPGATFMNIFGLIKFDLIPGALKIEKDSLLVYADPLIFEAGKPADFIFITHNHYDHFSPREITRLSGPKTLILGPRKVTKKLKKNRTVTVRVGDRFDYGRVKFEVVESYNIHSNLHKKGSDHLGYVITLDSTRIYVAGDTDFIPEMQELKNIDIAVIPIGEGKTAMDPESAAKAAQIIQPELVIPIHYEAAEGREEAFSKHLDKTIPHKLLQQQLKETE